MFKKVKALIEPLHLDEVKEALEELGIKGVTISNCREEIISLESSEFAGYAGLGVGT